jgi:hypothetical protein
MNDEDVFSFEDVDTASHTRVTTPLPGSATASRSFSTTAPGTLFGSSPRPVASGVTRGEKKEEVRVRLLHVSDPMEICGGVIGLPENKKFCAAHPKDCEFQVTHRWKKVDLQADTFYVMSPKKGAVHANLLPTLQGNFIPSDVTLSDLLDDERPVAMWHVYFDGCNASEESTGKNELQSFEYDTWEHLQRPSLDELERANDFKTPKKVRLHFDLEQEIKEEPVLLGPLMSLDLTRLQPIKDSSPSQTAVRSMFAGWEVIKKNFESLSKTMLARESRSQGDRAEARVQLREFETYLNDIGAKTRLLSAKIGHNPRGDSDTGNEESTIWGAISDLHSGLRLLDKATKNLPSPDSLIGALAALDQHKLEGDRLSTNMTKMYKHYKGHLTSSNARLVSLEKEASNLKHAPRAQAQEGDFDFGEDQGSSGRARAEIQELRNEIAEMRHNQATAPTSTPDSATDNPMFPTNTLAEMMARLAAVETRATTGDTCVLSGTSFPSEVSVGSYITTHSIPSCALYWDLFSIMVCMGRQGLTGKERSDRIYSAERGRTGSALEGELVASMTHKRPLCLFGEGNQLARLDQGFAMCKTYDHWIGGSEHVSYRTELSTQVRVYTDGIIGQIGHGQTPAHHLAHVLLNQVGM